MQPDNVTSWDDFNARKAARETGGQLADSIKLAKAVRKRKPAVGVAAPATLAELLRQAVHIATTRRGREPREVAVREQVLLEVLSDAMRRPE